MDFTGKVAISTGAASGMGLLFAENFAELGGNVVLCDVNENVLKEKVEEMINDKETVEYKQWWYEDNIQERYKFITEKKALIEKKSDKFIHWIENIKF